MTGLRDIHVTDWYSADVTADLPSAVRRPRPLQPSVAPLAASRHHGPRHSARHQTGADDNRAGVLHLSTYRSPIPVEYTYTNTIFE